MTTRPTPVPPVVAKRPDDLGILSRSRLLAALGPDDVAWFLDLLDQVTLTPGTCLFREGDHGDYMYFVLEGQARMRRGQLELAPVGPGDHFGELAMIGEKKRGASVEAHTTMRLARLSRAKYAELAARRPTVAVAFTKELATCLGELLVEMTDNVGVLAHPRSVPRRRAVHVVRGEERLDVAMGALVGTLLPREQDGAPIVSATMNKKPVSLETAVVSDADIGPLTLDDWEGRAVHRRSAALALLEAARRACPGVAVRMGSPFENGQLVLLPEPKLAQELAGKVNESLERVVCDDLPLREELWAIDEARAHLDERGWHDAAALLPTRRESTVMLVSCGETFALGLGPVVPRTSWLRGCSVTPHPAGLLLRLGDAVDRFMPMHRGRRVDPIAEETSHPRYGSEMSLMARRWLAGLGVTSVGRFDEHCVTGQVAELIRVAEGFHEKWIGRIADSVAQRGEEVKVIVIAGPSSSGKTTFIKRLTVQLLVNGRRPLNLSLDDYYVDREKTVRDENGEYDFEAFEAIDAALLQNHIGRLLAGERVKTARFDFMAGKSFASGGKELSLGEGDVLLVEGIHGLHPALVDGAIAPSAIYRIFVHPATTLAFDHLSVIPPEDMRLIRRLVRDRHQRNYTAAETILRWPSVRKGELTHIFPHLPNADAVFDSSLCYEMSVLKTYAERYLLEVPNTHPAFTTAFRLRQVLDGFVAIYPDHVPPTSVLREFIGGSGFEY